MKRTGEKVQAFIDITTAELEDIQRDKHHRHPFKSHAVAEAHEAQIKVRLTMLENVQATLD